MKQKYQNQLAKGLKLIEGLHKSQMARNEFRLLLADLVIDVEKTFGNSRKFLIQLNRSNKGEKLIYSTVMTWTNKRKIEQKIEGAIPAIDRQQNSDKKAIKEVLSKNKISIKSTLQEIQDAVNKQKATPKEVTECENKFKLLQNFHWFILSTNLNALPLALMGDIQKVLHEMLEKIEWQMLTGSHTDMGSNANELRQ